jgi:hypothetical protein
MNEKEYSSTTFVAYLVKLTKCTKKYKLSQVHNNHTDIITAPIIYFLTYNTHTP